ncbi:family 1 glycosylhydrolase, partial [Enterococcus faecalis]|uniref:family 1 glycosylhydrolase n=1 Tax=Enterococcus faecalis TaxID=1351 RepID=UPI003D6B340F
PSVSTTMSYLSSNKFEDVWAARMNDNLKTNYALEMYCIGEYPGYYQGYMTKCDIYPETQPEDQEIMKAAKIDFIPLN